MQKNQIKNKKLNEWKKKLKETKKKEKKKERNIVLIHNP